MYHAKQEDQGLWRRQEEVSLPQRGASQGVPLFYSLTQKYKLHLNAENKPPITCIIKKLCLSLQTKKIMEEICILLCYAEI